MMHLNRSEISTISPTAFQLVFVITVLLFAVPSGIYMFLEMGGVQNQFNSTVSNAYLLLSLALPAGTIWAVNRYRSLLPFYALLVVFFSGRIDWYTLITPDLASDFRTYWNLAHQYVTGARSLPLENIFQCRSYPYLVPVISVFGFNLFWLAVVNSAAMTVISLVTFRLTARIFSPAVAAGCVVFANMAPEVFGASAIPSHDVSGLFFFSLLLISLDIAVRMIQRQHKLQARLIFVLVGLALCTSVVIILLDLQRFPRSSIYLVFVCWLIYLATQFAGSLRTPDRLQKRTLFGVGMFVAAVVSLTVVISSSTSWLRTNCFTHDHEILNFITYAHSFSDGGYHDWHFAIGPMFGDVPTDEREDILTTLLLSDIADDPARRWEGIKDKSARLFALGSQRGFYLPQYSGRTAATQFFMAAAEAYRTVLLSLFMLAPVFLLLLFRRGLIGFDAVAYVPFLIISIMVFFMIMANQVQPRYIFPIYFFGALVYGSFFAWAEAIVSSDVRSRGIQGAISPAFVAVIALLLALPVVLYLGAGSAIDRLYASHHGRLIDLDQAGAGGTAREYPNVSRIPRKLKERRGLRAVLPVFGGYENWIWADRAGSQQNDYRFCGLPSTTAFELKGLAGIRPIDEKPGMVPPAGKLCTVRAGDLEHNCGAGGQFSLQPVNSDKEGCISFSHKFVRSRSRPAMASWLALVRAVQLPEPSLDGAGNK
jgi:uncharacterized membrane protein YwzB